MPIKTKKKQTKTTRQNRPSEIPLSGVPPIMHIKTKKKIRVTTLYYFGHFGNFAEFGDFDGAGVNTLY